ncbi:MAG: hypothetical protein IT198_05215 [Acidimicrobiia bacterium]|nr:hypothetical protein [Acidimicrobiia bacterium]
MQPLPDVVLFVSVDDAGAGPLAAAILNARTPVGLVGRSGGTAPADAVWPAVAQELIRLGAGTHVPAEVTDQDVARAYVVVTLGNPETCPVLPRTLYLDWSFPGVESAMYAPMVERILPLLERHVTTLIGTVLQRTGGD